MQKLTVQSTDRIHTLNVVTWFPIQKPVAVVQILTGMAEYIERYDAFAQFLADRGIIVIGHDHIGQGHSVQSNDELGYFGPNGLQTLVLNRSHCPRGIPRATIICARTLNELNASDTIC